MLTVSLIEDDEAYRELIGRSISASGKLRLLSSYPTAEEALKLLPNKKPDVALVDIKLPGMNGIECVRQFCAMMPPLPTQFIILTGWEDDQIIFDAFRVGAHGFLLKDRTSSKELYSAVQEVLAGGAPMTPRIARKVIGFIESRPRPAIGLSGREDEVLQRLAEGLAYKAIASELSISDNTVRKHVGSIYQKLQVHSRTEAAMRYAKQQGLRPGM